MRRIIPMIFLIIFEAIADIFATKRSQNQIHRRGVVALLFYLVCNVFWLFALKNGSGLGRGSIVFSVSCAILGVVIGVLLFKEHFTNIQIIGLVTGFISVVLLSIQS